MELSDVLTSVLCLTVYAASVTTFHYGKWVLGHWGTLRKVAFGLLPVAILWNNLALVVMNTAYTPRRIDALRLEWMYYTNGFLILAICIQMMLAGGTFLELVAFSRAADKPSVCVRCHGYVMMGLFVVSMAIFGRV